MDALDSFDLGDTVEAAAPNATPVDTEKRPADAVENLNEAPPAKRVRVNVPDKVKRAANAPVHLADLTIEKHMKFDDPRTNKGGNLYYPISNPSNNSNLDIYVKEGDGVTMPGYGYSRGMEDETKISYIFHLDKEKWSPVADRLLEEASKFVVQRGMVPRVDKWQKLVDEDDSRCIIKRPGPNKKGEEQPPMIKCSMSKYSKVHEFVTDENGNEVRQALTTEADFETLRNRNVRLLVLRPISVSIIKKMVTVKCFIVTLQVGPNTKDNNEAEFGYDYLVQ